MTDGARCKAAATGRRSRAAGEYWEGMIEASCRYFRLNGLAEIEKTPEPMKPLGRPNKRGQFLACYTKRAQPDYSGTLRGGRAVVFEAKCTEADRIRRSVITSEQEKKLDRHEALGAECFVLVTFGFRRFFKIPWAAFRDMKERYGRLYVRPEDMEEYEVKYRGGVLRFL